MMRAVSRLVVRVAIVAASFAWAGFVFANTVGDPGRGEQIARAVLVDDAARAEVVAPIASTVVRTAGFAPAEQPVVAGQVDALLRDPATARSFIDRFAGRWASLLGQADGRPADYDVAPLMGEILAAAPGFGGAPPVPTVEGFDGYGTETADTLVPEAVPLPNLRLDWLIPSRNTITRSSSVLAVVAGIGFAVAFAIGSRRWVARRFGVWAMLAGATWVIVPLLAKWAARRWASGVDSILSVVVDQAVSGVRVVALVLLIGGLATVVASFSPAPAWAASLAGGGEPDEAARSRVAESDDDAGVTLGALAGAPTRRSWRDRRDRPAASATVAMPAVHRPTDVCQIDGVDAEGDDPLWAYYA